MTTEPVSSGDNGVVQAERCVLNADSGPAGVSEHECRGDCVWGLSSPEKEIRAGWVGTAGGTLASPSSILATALAERDNYLPFTEARSKAKRGELTLPPGPTARRDVELGSKLQTGVGSLGPGEGLRGPWGAQAVRGMGSQKGASSEHCTQGTSTPLKTAEESAHGDSDRPGMTIPAQEERGNITAR